MRTFETKPAARERVPLLVGLAGPSGSGKTGSALELAHGVQEQVGGEIFVIDTEARRSTHYAGAPMFSDPKRNFNFQLLDFKPPFDSLSYLSAIEHCVKQGAKTIVIDSMSHEHDGAGGHLEYHETEAERLSKAWGVSIDKANMPAWGKPKAERRKLIQGLTQLGINAILCFRAKEKIKLAGGKPIPLGWQAIAGEEFIFEMSVHALLYPGCKGVPTWTSDEIGEKAHMKLPSYLAHCFKNGQPLSAAVGVQLAKWAAGGSLPVSAPASAPDPKKSNTRGNELIKEMLNAPNLEELAKVLSKVNAEKETFTADDMKALIITKENRKAALTAAPAQPSLEVPI